MRKFTFLAGIMVLFFNAGCASTINDAQLNLNIDNIQATELLPLKNGSNDITLYRLGSNIMEDSGFINKDGENYGYYVIRTNNRKNDGKNHLIFGWINGLTLFAPSLIGFPTESSEFVMTAFLYIFDSNGTLIKIYQNTNKFTQTTGLYYGQNPHKKASLYYSRLFTEILEHINNQKDQINYLLEESGPITNENMRLAQENITQYFSTRRN